MAKSQRKRYFNKTDDLQVVYDEKGAKRELIPQGTIIMDEEFAKRYAKVLAEKKPSEKKESGKGKDK